jgi:P-type conjugative transfer protein TrbL
MTNPVTDLGTLETVLHNFTAAISGTWGPQLVFYLQPVLLAIIVLQFGLVAAEATIERDIPLLISHTMIGLLRIGVVWSIFTNGFTWANSIVETGQDLGNNISGFGLTPSGVFDTGISVMHTIFATEAAGTWFNQIFEKFEFYMVGFFVMSAWAIASIIYLGALIEGVLLVYVGPLIIAFTPLSWTFELLLIWGRSLLGIAFRTALILMTLAVGMSLANSQIAAFTATSATFTTDIWNVLIGLVEAVIFSFCVLKIPNTISGMAGGAAVMGFGQGLLGLTTSGGSAAYAALGGNGGSANNSSDGGGADGSGEGGGADGGQPNNNTGSQQAAQEMAAKVQTMLVKG